jgi:hypothetical protein
MNPMTTRRLGLISAVLLSALPCAAQRLTNSSQTEKFPSPDGTISAFVRSNKAPEATKESRIELRSQHGRILASRDYMSKDGEHGHGVTMAAWTPDSQFFVYSLESSGGHQAWHTPVQFFSRSKNKFVSLDDALKDEVTNPRFLVTAPDSVTVELMSMKLTKTVSLQGLICCGADAGQSGRKPRRTITGLPRYMTDIPQAIPDEIKLPDAPETARTIRCFRSFTSNSAMTDVVKKCGIPDEHQGSGIWIFLYDMEDGSVVAVGTADLKRLLYIDHIETGRSFSLLQTVHAAAK